MNFVLKNCPCCGSKAEIVRGETFGVQRRSVRCTECRLESQKIFVDKPLITVKSYPHPDESTRYTDYEATRITVDLWNKRVDLKDAPVRAEVKAEVFDKIFENEPLDE